MKDEYNIILIRYFQKGIQQTGNIAGKCEGKRCAATGKKLRGRPFLLRRFLGFYIGYCNDIDFPGCHWCGILCVHEEALYRADVYTGPTDDTAEPVDLPGFCFFGHDNCLGRADALAGAAGDAPAFVNGDMATRQIRFFAGFCRVGNCNRRVEECSYRCFCHFKKCHSESHLSAQPIQGSMDMIMTGTSASSQPCSILTSGGMFVRVGVRIRDRTKNFVPFPLT